MRQLPPFPKFVKGAVADYSVLNHTSETANAGEHDYGSLDGPAIRVGTNLNDNYRWHTFIHELIHKWEVEGGFKLDDEDGDSDVDRLAVALFADFLRNGWKLPGEK